MVGQLGNPGGANLPDFLFVGLQGMAREKNPEQVLLEGEAFSQGPFLDLGIGKGVVKAVFRLGGQGKEGFLLAPALFLGGLRDTEHLVQGLEQAGPGDAHRVKGPTLDEAFENPFVRLAQIQPDTEIEEGGKRALRLSLPHDHIRGSFPHVLDAGQAKPDPIFLHREIQIAAIDVGGQNLDTHVPTAINVTRQLVGIVHFDT